MKHSRLLITVGIVIAICGFTCSSGFARTVNSQPELIHGHAPEDLSQIRMAVVQALNFNDSDSEWIDSATNRIADLIRQGAMTENDIAQVTRRWRQDDEQRQREVARVRAIAHRDQLILPEELFGAIVTRLIATEQAGQAMSDQLATVLVRRIACMYYLSSEYIATLSRSPRPSIDQLVRLLTHAQVRLTAARQVTLTWEEIKLFTTRILRGSNHRALLDTEMEELRRELANNS